MNIKSELTQKVLNFLIEKATDFILDRVGHKIDNKQSSSIELSESAFERSLRRDLDELTEKVTNLEAVVEQGKILFTQVMIALSDSYSSNQSFIGHVHGDISITINIFPSTEPTTTIGNNAFYPLNDIRNLVEKKASRLFDIVDADDSSTDLVTEFDSQPSATSSFFKNGFISRMKSAIKEVDEFVSG